MADFARLKRHLFTNAGTARKAFPLSALQAIETAIAEGEMQHRAEVRLVVEHSLPLQAVLRDVTARQRAIELFARYRIWDTEDNCGVLIYVNLADRKVEIVADRAIARLVAQEAWDAACQTMTDGFARGEFRNSSVAAVMTLNALLQAHFPAQGTRPNQLPNQPIVL